MSDPRAAPKVIARGGANGPGLLQLLREKRERDRRSAVTPTDEDPDRES